jgi:hypothetical protein
MDFIKGLMWGVVSGGEQATAIFLIWLAQGLEERMSVN